MFYYSTAERMYLFQPNSSAQEAISYLEPLVLAKRNAGSRYEIAQEVGQDVLGTITVVIWQVWID